MPEASFAYKCRRFAWMKAGLVLLCLALPSAARGDAAKDFHAIAGQAFAHYRQAVFYLRRGAPEVAAVELSSFSETWDGVVEKFAAAPPGPYEKDRSWGQTLREISITAEKGRKLADAGDTAQSGKVLAPLRNALSELRQRNGIYLFADCINDANKAFRKLFYYRHNPPRFETPTETDALKKALENSIQWYDKCRKMAPPPVAADPQFERLTSDSIYFLERMKIAIKEKNQLNVVNILRRVVSSDDILWLKFG